MYEHTDGHTDIRMDTQMSEHTDGCLQRQAPIPPHTCLIRHNSMGTPDM